MTDGKPNPAAVIVECAMSGPMERLTVKPAGLFGVHFIYGDEAGVIVHGDDLEWVRGVIDQQLSNWKRHKA